MSRYREVCKTTLKPRRWLNSPIVTQQCLIGACEDCHRSYYGKGWRGLFYNQDMWANEYSLCNNVDIDDLVVYK